jgi:hypothetical protein
MKSFREFLEEEKGMELLNPKRSSSRADIKK